MIWHYADASPEMWEKLLGGQAGFILATVMFGVFFWKVLLPRWDNATQQIAKLADAVNALVSQNAENTKKCFDELMRAVEKRNDHD